MKTYLAAASPSGVWNPLIISPVALPDGYVKRYFKINSLLSGTKTNTPAEVPDTSVVKQK